MNKWTLVGTLLLGCLLMTVSGTSATATNLEANQRAPHISSVTADSTPPAQDSLGDWWKRSKKALHHLSACALGSAGLSYALIAGVALPGPGTIGVIGAGIMVLMCL